MKLLQQVNEQSDLLAEKSDEEQMAAMTFKIMMKISDDIESSLERLDRVQSRMKKLGLEEEHRRLNELLEKANNEFLDFMPGLEMQAKGE